MPLVQIRSAEFFVQLTAAKHGRRFSRKMKTLAASTLFSIRTILTSFSHHFGRGGGSRGFSPVAAQAADFIDQKIMEWCGNVWRETDSRERSEEHTSELQSLRHLVCRLLLEK